MKNEETNTTKKWGYYEQMRPKEIEHIQQKTPIAYLPWGAIEYHGSHNPTGLDSIKAHHMVTDLAKKNGGLVFPTINLAANLISSYPGVHFPHHSIEFSEKLIRLICEEYFEQLAHQGFKIIVLLSGHAGQPHLDILKSVAKEFNQKYSDLHFWAFAEFEIIPDELLVANHSAIGETAIQLHYAPETVALETLPKKGKISLEIHAVSGNDPRAATKELGQKIATTFITNASEKLETLLKNTYEK